MDYKEKLRLAKEALESGSYDKETIEYIFPELKESEDKRIRKAIVKMISDIDGGFPFEKYGIIKKEAIAWLEKQWEQKPTDKVEPKFKAGDFITDGERIFKIKETVWERNNRNDGITYCESLIVNLRDWNTYVDNTDLKKYHLWTIQDAKDGDVLVASDGSIFIFKETEDCGCKHYIAIEKDSKTINVNDNLEHFWESIRGVKPSTKEQRDLLFAKMKEAGYEWDAEKKELKRIEQEQTELPKGEDYAIDGLWQAIQILEHSIGEVDGWQSDDGILEHKCAIEAVNRLYKQKPAWIQWTGKNLEEVIDFTGKSPRFDEWFKSWDEYKAYVHSHGDIFKLFCADGSHYEVPVGAWIVKTPDGYNIPSRFKFIQKSTEWSEEDEQRIESAIEHLENSISDTPSPLRPYVRKDIDWLRSLKQRMI